MAALISVRGPNPGKRFPLTDRSSVIGRQDGVSVHLESLAVSRYHARIINEGGAYFVEDTGSANGTWVNGQRISKRVALNENDTLQIGPYEFNLLVERPPIPSDLPQIVRGTVDAQSVNLTLYGQNAGVKLKAMLEITRDLGHTLDLDPLLIRLLEHLLALFTQADRGMVLLCEGDRLVVRAQWARQGGATVDFAYSRTIVRRALSEGVGLLSEDVRGDQKINLVNSIIELNVRSFLCVPLLGWDNRRLGVIQLDCLRPNQVFKQEDLELLTAVALQAAVVLQNAAYHVERLREERLRQEVLLARDIQQQFLPADFDVIGPTAELFAHCQPAREVSGDLYDFFPLPDKRFAFYVGDVSGKGMGAALFMIAVRTLARYLAPSAAGAADFLQRLNMALATENPTHLFVTMMYGVYDPADGSVTLANGGHPLPLLRQAAGDVHVLNLRPGMLLGSAPIPLRVSDTRVELHPGDTLLLYTDGYLEATAPDGKTEFGIDRLKDAFGGPGSHLGLEETMVRVNAAIRRFSGHDELQDDQTLLLLRRR
ncbi:MAG: SpoIIE family protein phosphatase [Gemmataceae bacterium]